MTVRTSRGVPMATCDVIVVGAGVAGTAVALSAARAGLSVLLLDGGSGASTLSTGALDGSPTVEPIRAALEVLGGYALLPDRGARLLTLAGVVRRADGHDASLLDVGSLPAGTVGVVRCRRPGWDADALAGAWGRGYLAIDARLARYVGEDMLPDADFAARHDDDARLGWLGERLREAMSSADRAFAAIALPPALGIDRCRAHELSLRVGVRCGEAIGLPGGPAGLRFERARDRALAASCVRRVRARAHAVLAAAAGWRIETDTGETLSAANVVLAAGGLIGGGIEYAPGEATLATALPPRSRTAFRVGFESPAVVAAHGRALEPSASLFGPAPERIADSFGPESTFERAGVMTSALGAIQGAPGLFAAGDIVADAPRTWLTAFAAGWGIGRGLGAAFAFRTAAPPLTDEPPFSAPPMRP